MVVSKKIVALMLIGLSSLCGEIQASDGALSITLENDIFTGSDNNYTNGLGITWVSGAVDTGDDGFVGRWTRFWSFLPYVADDGYETYASWSLVQEINTPDDIQDPYPSLDDQPYSGILSVDSTLYSLGRKWAHSWELKLGIAGPAAHADDAQEGLHKLIGSDEPMGWDTQLPNELILNLGYSNAHVAAAGSLGESAQWRVVPIATAGIGNYFTGASFGVYGEVGWNLVDALGVAALRSGMNAASSVGVNQLDHWSVSFFGGAGVYGVIHFLPLDGTLFRDSRSVDSEPFIGIGSFGFCVRRKSLTLSFSWTRFTEAFDTQRAEADFGTVSLAWLL
jgi:hypothetical protein